MRKRNLGKILCIFTIVLAFTLVGMGLFLFNRWLNTTTIHVASNTETTEENGVKVIKANDVYYDNRWSKAIIDDVADQDVPIPEGFEYVQGTKETGVVIRDKITNQQMLWIPYDNSVTEEKVAEYYQNCDYVPMDLDTKEAIALYGGFYVTLEQNNQYEVLKQVGDESYQTAYSQAKELYKSSNTVNSHLIHKTELAQILSYSEKIGLTVAPTKTSPSYSYQIQLTENEEEEPIAHGFFPGVIVNVPEAYDESLASDETVVYEFDREKVVVPAGFIPAETTMEIAASGTTEESGKRINAGSHYVVKIQDENNENLRYIWIPTTKKELTTAISKVKEYYQNQMKTFDGEGVESVRDSVYDALLDSVDTYGGFYIAEAELGYDENGKAMNRARGMKTYHAYDGDYYRGTEFGTYEEAVKKASELHADNETVTSHLTYGVEWDAVLTWLVDTHIVTEEQVVVNSSTVPGAKYKDVSQVDSEGNVIDSALQGVNGIYGLAGNLFELTQETAVIQEEVRHVLRGGSFLYTEIGGQFPMASRLRLKDDAIVAGDDIGFRNCLFINTETTKKTIEEPTSTVKKTKEKFIFGQDTFYFENDESGFVGWDRNLDLTIAKQILGDKKENLTEQDFWNLKRGACFGMTVSNMLIKNGYINLNEMQPDVAKISELKYANDLSTPAQRKEVCTLIASIHQLQELYAKYNPSTQEELKRIVEYLQNPNEEVGICIDIELKIQRKGETGGSIYNHAILGVDVQEGNFIGSDGEEYQYQVTIYDPNIKDEPQYLYIKADYSSYVYERICKQENFESFIYKGISSTYTSEEIVNFLKNECHTTCHYFSWITPNNVATSNEEVKVASETIREFNIQKDIYQFNNNHANFETEKDYQNKKDGYYIDDKFVQALGKNHSDTVKAKLEEVASQPFGGACYGINLSAALMKNGKLTPDYWQKGARDVVDLKSPLKNQNVLNLIEYYFLAQHLPEMEKYEIDFLEENKYEEVIWSDSYFEKDDELIERLVNGLTKNKGEEYLLGVVFARVYEDSNTHSKINQIGGHSLLAFDIQDVSSLPNYAGYRYCVDVYDSNLENGWGVLYITDNMDIEYHNLGETGDDLGNIYQSNGKQAMVLTLVANTNEVTVTNPEEKDFLNETKLKEYLNDGKRTTTETNIPKTINVITVSSNVTLSSELGYMTLSPKGVIEKHMPAVVLPSYDSDMSSHQGVRILLDNEKEYTIRSENGEEDIEVEMMFGDTYQVIKAKAGSEIKVGEEGNVSIQNNRQGEYSIEITSNNKNESMNWGTVKIEGKDSDDISIARMEQGVLINSDNLGDVNLQMRNPATDNAVMTSIATSSQSAIVRTEENANENTKTFIYTDEDQDGVYDNKTQLEVEVIKTNLEQMQKGSSRNTIELMIIIVVGIVGVVILASIIIFIQKKRVK